MEANSDNTYWITGLRVVGEAWETGSQGADIRPVSDECFKFQRRTPSCRKRFLAPRKEPLATLMTLLLALLKRFLAPRTRSLIACKRLAAT